MGDFEIAQIDESRATILLISHGRSKKSSTTKPNCCSCTSNWKSCLYLCLQLPSWVFGWMHAENLQTRGLRFSPRAASHYAPYNYFRLSDIPIFCKLHYLCSR